MLPRARHVQPARLRKLYGADLVLANELAAGGFWELLGGHGHWQVQLFGQVSLPMLDEHACVHMSVAGIEGDLVCSIAAFEQLMALSAAEMPMARLHPDLQLALLQHCFDTRCAASLPNQAPLLLVHAWASVDRAVKRPVVLGVCLRGSGLPPAGLYGYWCLDAAQAKALATLADRSRPAMLPMLHALPLRLRLELGWVDVQLQQLQSVREQDVLLPDSWWGNQARRRLCLRVSARYGMPAELRSDGTLRTLGGVTMMEQEPIGGSAETGSEAVTNLNDIPVRVTFDLGECTIPLEQLRTIGPGYVFDLARVVTRAVTLRVNGVILGDGEIVDIDGRIGVAITNLVQMHHESN